MGQYRANPYRPSSPRTLVKFQPVAAQSFQKSVWKSSVLTCRIWYKNLILFQFISVRNGSKLQLDTRSEISKRNRVLEIALLVHITCHIAILVHFLKINPLLKHFHFWTKSNTWYSTPSKTFLDQNGPSQQVRTNLKPENLGPTQTERLVDIRRLKNDTCFDNSKPWLFVFNRV